MARSREQIQAIKASIVSRFGRLGRNVHKTFRQTKTNISHYLDHSTAVKQSPFAQAIYRDNIKTIDVSQPDIVFSVSARHFKKVKRIGEPVFRNYVRRGYAFSHRHPGLLIGGAIAGGLTGAHFKYKRSEAYKKVKQRMAKKDQEWWNANRKEVENRVKRLTSEK